MADVSIDKALDIRAETGEGPVWSERDQALWWVDIPKGHLNRFDPSGGTNEVYPLPSTVGCLALAAAGGLIVALESGFEHFDPQSQRLTHLVQPEPDRPHNRYNDGTTDPAGRFWAGTMPKAGARRERGAEGALYWLDRDGTAHQHSSGYFTQNGLAFSPDGDTFYVSDTAPWVRTIWAYDFDVANATTRNRRVFFDTRAVAGRPDGGTVDADGCYWMAGVGGSQLVRLTPAGKIDRLIELPCRWPSKMAFGEAGLDTMFVTSIRRDPAEDPEGGAIFAVRAGIQGLPQALYTGPIAASSAEGLG